MRNLCAIVLLFLIVHLPFLHASWSDTDWSIGHRQLPVFGIEINLDGVICSSSLPNGSVVGLVALEGGQAYRDSMQKMFTWMEAAALKGKLPAWKVERDDYLRLKHTVDDFLDLPALTGTVSEAKTRALAVLKSHHNVTVNETLALPQIIIAHPSFLMNEGPTPYTTDDEGETTYTPREPAEYWHGQAITKWRLLDVLNRATFAAGFREFDDWGFKLPPDSDSVGAYFPEPAVAATFAVCKATGGFCETSYYSGTYFYEEIEFVSMSRPNTTCARPEEVVIVAEMNKDGLQLWVEGIKGCQVHGRTWSFHQDLSATNLDDGLGKWRLGVREGINNVVKQARHKDSATADVSLLTTGGFWTDRAREELSSVATKLGMNMTMFKATSKRDEVFGASMASAAGGMLQNCRPNRIDTPPTPCFVESAQLCGD